ncbi:hypothetical protein HDU76_005551, partial [Blyttiomyces sp. JEL0837]
LHCPRRRLQTAYLCSTSSSSNDTQFISFSKSIMNNNSTSSSNNKISNSNINSAGVFNAVAATAKSLVNVEDPTMQTPSKAISIRPKNKKLSSASKSQSLASTNSNKSVQVEINLESNIVDQIIDSDDDDNSIGHAKSCADDEEEYASHSSANLDEEDSDVNAPKDLNAITTGTRQLTLEHVDDDVAALTTSAAVLSLQQAPSSILSTAQNDTDNEDISSITTSTSHLSIVNSIAVSASTSSSTLDASGTSDKPTTAKLLMDELCEPFADGT